MTKQIFIGGTGRSGTTILAEMLSKHNDIYKLPNESRFIVDPGGIIDLVPSLSTNWSHYSGDASIKRFRKMMYDIYPPIFTYYCRLIIQQILKKTNMSPQKYVLWPYLNTVIQRRMYIGELNIFINSLMNTKFRGYWIGSDPYRLSNIISPKRFDRNEILKLSRNYVNNLYSYPLKKTNKSIWLDDTPFNILHAGFLYELFPDMKLIHIYRDIRDVISSYKTMHWGGKKSTDLIMWIKNIFDKWEEEKKKIPKDVFTEIEFEKLIENPKKVINGVTKFLGIDFDDNIINIDLSKSHIKRWKTDLKKEEIYIIEKELSGIIKKYNYEVSD